MTTRLSLVTTLVLLWAADSTGLAQDANAAPNPANARAAAWDDMPTPAQLQARLHQTMAALVEARAAEKADPEKIRQLAHQLRAVRAEMQAQSPSGPYGPGGGAGICPWGGPGLGPGPAWGGGPGKGGPRGGPGRGYGRGAGWGQGQSPGPAAQRGRGPGHGYGPGGAHGPGGVRGLGYGGGAGWGVGQGPGFGPRSGYVDQDQNGICDNFERVWGER